MAKRFTSFRLSEECHSLLAAITERRGLNRTAAIEAGVRMLAESIGVQAPTLPTKGEKSPPKKSRKTA